jgi:hypothetical protein
MPRRKLNTDQTDHSHTCQCCGHTYACQFYNLKHCQTKGVLKAVQINRQGPFCSVCAKLIMATRLAAHRGWKLEWKLGTGTHFVTERTAPVI